MRMFFLFLVLLNLLFAAWQYYQPAKNEVMIRPLPDRLKPLVLLSETELPVYPQPETVLAAGAADTIAANAVQEDQLLCFTLGPYTDKAQVEQIQLSIEAGVQHSALRNRTEKELHRYWIYLPATPNRSAAIDISKSLARHKIKDYYIVQGGEYSNRISLGHYKEKLHAERRMKQLKAFGYEPEMQPIYREYEVYWLDYGVRQSRHEHNDPVSAYIVEEVSRLARECE